MVWSNGEGKLTWGRRCPCPLVVAHAPSSLLVSARRCPRPFMFVGGRFHPRAVVFVHALVRGRLSSRVPFSPRRHVNGWWCWALAAARGAGPSSPFVAGGVVTVLCRRSRPWGGPLTVRGVGARLVCYPVCTVVLGLQTRLVKWGGDDDRVAAHIPQRPHHIRGVGAPCHPLSCLHHRPGAANEISEVGGR